MTRERGSAQLREYLPPYLILRALGAHSLWLGSVWPQPDTQHCDPLGNCCSLAGKHTAPTVSVERHKVQVLAQAGLLS